MRTRELEAPAEERRLAYQSELRRIMSRADTLDAEAIKALRELVSDLRERVIARVTRELRDGKAMSSWGAFWVPRLTRSLDSVIEELATKAGPLLGKLLADSWQLGADLFELPTRAVFPDMEILPAAIDLTAVTTIAPFSAKLITQVSDATREVVNRSIRTSVVMGESPFTLMQTLAAGPLEKGPWKTLAYRTEIISRTEYSRVQTVASEARMQQAVLQSPGLLQGRNRLQQVFTSVQIGEWPCEICEPLDGTIWEIDDPKKPVPPMHPNCRCMLSPWIRGVSKLGTLPPVSAVKQRRASVVECYCCG